MKNKETLEEAAEKYANKKGDIPTTKLEDTIFKQGFIDGAKWQQEQEQDNENSWFNQYQEIEDYIIKRIGNKFLEATPEKYNTASEATIALLENNWQQERIYTEDDMLNFAWFLKENLGQFSCDRTAHFEGKYLEQFKKK